MGKIVSETSGEGGSWPECNDLNTADVSEQPLSLAWLKEGPEGSSVLAFMLPLGATYGGTVRFVYWEAKMEDVMDAMIVFHDKWEEYQRAKADAKWEALKKAKNQ